MKPESCKPCPYYTRTGPVWGVGSSSAKLAILGQSPGPEEVAYNDVENGVVGFPFVGSSGRVLNRSLSSAGIERSREFTSNIVKCFVAPGESLHPLAVKCCAPLLEKELSHLPRCKTILTLGQPAFNAVTGKELHIVHTRAKLGTKGTKSTTRNPNAVLRGCPVQVGDYTIIGTYHPAYLMRTGFRESPIFDSDTQKVGRISRGERETFVEHFNFSPTNGEVEEYVRECIEVKHFGLDIETPWKKESEEEELELTPVTKEQTPSEIEVVGLSAREGEVLSVRPDQIPLIAPLMDPQSETFVYAFNGSFDLENIRTHLRIGPSLRLFDGMLALNLLYSEVRPKDLAVCLSLFTDLPYTKNLSGSDPDRYNAYDTFGVLMAGKKMWKILENWGLINLFWNHDMAVLPTLNEMKLIGARCDVRRARQFEVQCYQALDTYSKWWDTNIPSVSHTSPKQLIPFFTALGMPPQFEVRIDKNKNRIKTPTANDDALKLYEEGYNCGAAKLIRTMRTLKKAGDFCGFYDSSGRAHSSFSLHRQVGGRIQSDRPNLQNLPEEIGGTKPRSIIVGDEDDCCVINADYEQVEVWVYTYLTQDPMLVQAKKDGTYIHGVFYEILFKEPFFQEGFPRKKKFMRHDIPPWKLLRAKTFPLGLLYGRKNMQEQGLSKQEGETIYNNFHKDHPAIGEFHKRLDREAERTGRITNCFGRFRRFPNPAGMKNEMYNYPGQSNAADIVRQNCLIPLGPNNPLQNKSQREASNAMKDLKARIILHVYDQILVSVPRRNLLECMSLIKKEMESPIPEMGNTTIPVSMKVGDNWGELVSVDEYTSSRIAN